MTARDYHLNHAKLASLEGRKCFLTMVTNSIKLHIDRNERDGTYLWIDPPWVFGTLDAEVASSQTCPDSHDADYEAKFKQWGEQFTPMYENAIDHFETTQRGRLVVFFASGHVLLSPAIEGTKEERGWYDHWYVSRKPGRSPDKLTTTDGQSDYTLTAPKPPC